MRVALLIAALALVGCAPATPSERAGWSADFEQLVDHVAAVYANLEWAVDERRIDVHALAEQTRAELATVGSERAARKAIERFVRGFDDPHFYVQRGDRRNRGGAAEPDRGLDPEIGSSAALNAMGFNKRNLEFRLAFSKFPGFERLRPSEANPFSWAHFDVGGWNVGLVRIAHFGEDGYPAVAEPLWSDFTAELDGPCDISCQWRFRERVMDALLGYLAEGARTLRESGVDALLIDLSGNGGGTDWAAVAPRIFAPPLTRCPPIGVVRHPHHVTLLEQQVAHVQSMLDAPALSAASRATLERARDAVVERHRQSQQPCDRRALFDTEAAELDCTQLVFGSGCGMVEYLPMGALADVEGRASVFRPLGSRFDEGIWDGPLFVVTDGNTASASEHFVALLEANDAATFIGAPTLGAGCGFVGGGVPAYLEQLDLTVRMPDCARYRASGRNEIEGIEPDLAVELDARSIHAALEGQLPPGRSLEIGAPDMVADRNHAFLETPHHRNDSHRQFYRSGVERGGQPRPVVRAVAGCRSDARRPGRNSRGR